MTLEPVIVEKANLEELVETNQLLTNVNNLLEPSTIATANLCDFLKIPPPMTKNAYDDLSYSIKIASKQVEEESMPDAAARLRWTKPTADVGVSVDGS